MYVVMESCVPLVVCSDWAAWLKWRDQSIRKSRALGWNIWNVTDRGYLKALSGEPATVTVVQVPSC